MPLRSGWDEIRPVVSRKLTWLCVRPYPGHPRGCPNYGKRDTCPPVAPALYDLLDSQRPIFVVWNRFDLASHAARMRDRHPHWSERQVYCCLYWQPTARKQLRQQIKTFLEWHPEIRVILTPEACGVNVTATMARVGIHLEWPPRQAAYQFAVAGYPAADQRPTGLGWSHSRARRPVLEKATLATRPLLLGLPWIPR